MIKYLSICVLVSMMTAGLGCRIYHPSYELLENNQHSVDNLHRFYFVDLNGDCQDELVIINEKIRGLTEITLRSAGMEVYSQLNIIESVHHLSFFDFDDDDDKEIYISVLDEEGVITVNRFRYEWTKVLRRTDNPVFRIKTEKKISGEESGNSGYLVVGKGDIDGNSFNELFLQGYSGYDCFPRGLWVVDAETGEEKWRYELAGNIKNIYYTDLDNDGEEEFVISTQALKNHKEIVNGTDDFHSYLLVLSKSGKLLHQEELARGYSNVECVLEDVDNDGIKEIIAVKKTWGNQNERNGIFIFKWMKNRLNLVKVKQFEATLSMRKKVFFEDLDNNGKREIMLLDDKHNLIAFENNLEIIYRYSNNTIHKIAGVIDLDCDGNTEIIAVTNDGYIDVLNSKLQPLAHYGDRNVSNSQVALYNPGFGKKKQIVIYEKNNFRFFEYKASDITRIIKWRMIILLLLITIILILVYKYIKHKLKSNCLKEILNCLETAVMITNEKNQITDYNLSMEKLFGLVKIRKKLSCSGCLLGEIINEELSKFRETSQIELKCHLPEINSGHKHELHLIKLRGCKKSIMVIITDQTDLSQLEEKVQWAETARGLSHGIRKHLNNILLASEQISITDNSTVKKMSGIILEEVGYLKYFIQSFQRFTELNKLQLQIIDTNKFIIEYLNELIIDIPKNIKFISEMGNDLPQMKLDKVRFIEMLNNILVNSIEAIGSDGTIIFRVYSMEDGKLRRKVCFEISDSGRGISENLLDQVFLPYFTTKEGGTGIGLALVKKMMDEFMGEVEIESKVEVGTTIRLIFPASEKE